MKINQQQILSVKSISTTVSDYGSLPQSLGSSCHSALTPGLPGDTLERRHLILLYAKTWALGKT